MKNLYLLIFLQAILISCNEKAATIDEHKDPSNFEGLLSAFPEIDEAPAHKVMTLGVFHFDRSLDGSDVIAKNHIDISTNQNKAELDSLLAVLKQFKPTRIAVEWRPSYQSTMDSLYDAYQKGSHELGKNEAFQIGFNLANQLGLDKVYCIDNNPPMPETINAIDDWDLYAEELGHTELWHKYDTKNEEYLTFMDTLQNSVNLYDYLTLMNSPKNIKRRKQLWTTGLVNVGHGDTYLGADLLGRWYRRNTRIFVNAKNLAANKNETILIIYGSAHKWILDELFESSPEFDVVQLNDLR